MALEYSFSSADGIDMKESSTKTISMGTASTYGRMKDNTMKVSGETESITDSACLSKMVASDMKDIFWMENFMAMASANIQMAICTWVSGEITPSMEMV